jgi:hypothetical protein
MIFKVITRTGKLVCCTAFVCLLLGRPPAQAEELHAVAEWKPVGEAVLATMRGGFQGGVNDPFISFGIERAVSVNGKLVTSTTLTIPNLAQLASGGAGSMLTVTQNGLGNAFSAADPHSLMTVIQNTLDNQAIQSKTTINASVAALSWAKSLAYSNSLNQAIAASVRR